MSKKKRIKGNPGCTNCPLHEKSSNTCIMGMGAIPAKIMVVLDNPTLADADNEMPISGRNLIYLQEMFEKAGINWNDCYITTTVKCGVPKGTKLKASDIKACSEYLSHEFDAVRPRFILTMGATALKAIMGKGKITDVHGTVMKHSSGAKVVPVYAPGVVWRDPSKIEDMERDLSTFADLVGGVKHELPETNFYVVENSDDFERMIRDISKESYLSWDIETTGLNRFKDKITVMGFGLKDKQWILPFSLGKFGREVLQMMWEIITETIRKSNIKIITQNGKFDNLFSRHNWKYGLEIYFDTMIAAYALDENTPNGLKYQARKVFRVPDYDVDIDTKKGGKTDNTALYKYLAYDVIFTRKLFFHFRKELRKDEPTNRLFWNLLMPAFRMYENVQMEGVYINQDKFDEVDRILTERIEEIDEELDEIRIASGYPKPINWGSTKQLADYLYDYLKLPVLGKTATGNPSTAGDYLLKLKDEHPSIRLIVERKGLKQLHSFFINGWKDKLQEGKLYPNFNIHVTVTGRTSSNEPNLQQVPRDKRIRTLIGAPPGWTMVEIDYSQAELRIAGELSDDPKIQMVYALGKDIHTNTAVSISGKNEDTITKEDRKKAKPVNFGFVYGMGYKKFVEYADTNYGVILTEDEAFEYRKRFFEEYNYLPKWHDKQRRIVRQFKQVRSLIGRLRRLPDIDSPDKGVRSEAERQAINSPVQSFASDLMLMALIEIDETLPKEHVRIVGSVHDAGLYIIRNDQLNKYVPIIKNIMEKPKLLTECFNVHLKTPIVADVEVGNWGAGVPWQEGQYINLKEDGTAEMVDEPVRHYLYHPESDCYVKAISDLELDHYLKEGCIPISKYQYMKGKGLSKKKVRRKGKNKQK